MSPRPGSLRIEEFGPEALIVESPGVEAAAVGQWIREVLGDRARQVIPGDRTVTVHCATRHGRPADVETLRRQWTGTISLRSDPADTLICPVRFDGEDLEEVADRVGLEIPALIALIENLVLEVAFCGFAPGFGYLRGLPEILHLPRRASPRHRVPAGSVAIAAGYGAIYPHASPGGWHLIGTCDLPLWDVTREPPAEMRPGRRVVLRALHGELP